MGDKDDPNKGTRYDDTLNIEGQDHVELVEVDGEVQMRCSTRGAGTTTKAGDEVLIERSKNHGKNPCDVYGHRNNGSGVCRFCGSPC